MSIESRSAKLLAKREKQDSEQERRETAKPAGPMPSKAKRGFALALAFAGLAAVLSGFWVGGFAVGLGVYLAVTA